jgi:hypothetical protein
MHTIPRARRQHGAVMVTAAFVLLFLLGFMGVALDFGHLFIARSELQTAVDSCALAAAQELDGNADALTRAASAGISAGNANAVNMQSANWSGRGQIAAGDLAFFDASYTPTASDAAARYARCRHTQPGIAMWLLKAMGAFSRNAAAYPATQSVMAQAVATRAPAQATCPLPLALKPKTGQGAPDYGFAVGEWVTLLNAQNAATGGQIGWANLDGSNNAAETELEMRGRCGTRVGDTLGTPGVQTAIADAWNARFGIYKNNSGPAIEHPDFTGYGYTAANWPAAANADNDFVSKRPAAANCANTGTKVKGANSCESITGLSLNSFTTLATAGINGELRRYGVNRRLATVPVVDAGNKVIDYACMLMLQPMPVPMATQVKLEYRGNAAIPGSPCTGNGLPGGFIGPRVPVLVR